jgi:hypothetical protein
MTASQTALLIAFNGLIFWQSEKRPWLWVIGAFLNTIVGLLSMAGNTQWSMDWMFGFAIVMLGCYCFVEFIAWGLEMQKKRGNKRG